MGFFNFFRREDINLGVEEYKTTDGAVLIDVRTTEEYKEGHIDGSINIPLDQIMTVNNIIKDRETPIFVYCLSGSRSGQVVSYLQQMRYKKAKNIGGISHYQDMKNGSNIHISSFSFIILSNILKAFSRSSCFKKLQ